MPRICPFLPLNLMIDLTMTPPYHSRQVPKGWKAWQLFFYLYAYIILPWPKSTIQHTIHVHMLVNLCKITNLERGCAQACCNERENVQLVEKTARDKVTSFFNIHTTFTCSLGTRLEFSLHG